MSSIYEVAKIAGVSPSTVARALNNKGYCSYETKKKIIEIAKQINYKPVHTAKMLKYQRTDKILFCMPDVFNPFYFGMFNGINEVVNKYGYYIILGYTQSKLSEELKMIKILGEKYADGMILVSHHFCKENIQAVNECNMPVVLTNQYVSEDQNDVFDYVYVDTRKGAYLLTEHLIKQGHRKIVFIGADKNTQTGYERFCGFRDALKAYGIDYNDTMMYVSNYTKESGYNIGCEILKKSERPTGVVSINDLTALGFMNACKDKNIKIGEEISVVGMDNTDCARCVTPNLTSLSLREDEIGRIAAQLLIERLIEGRTERKTVKLEPRLYVR